MKETTATVKEMEKMVPEVEELPKEKLSDCSPDYDINLRKDAHLSASENNLCKESKRETMNAEDGFKALEEIEFSEFV